MKITVIGDGGWGTALALVLSRREDRTVTVWGPDPAYAAQVQSTRDNARFLPGVPLPPAIAFTADPAEALAGADAVVLVSPSKYVKSVLDRFAPFYAASAHPPVVSATKGFDPAPPHARITQLLAAAWPDAPVAALSGPSIAGETARGIPTAVTIASPDPAVAAFFQSLFLCDTFRPYTASDIVGLELGGALKNVIAIAAGVCDGLGYGANAKAAIITRGIAEMTRLGVALGADPRTFCGLSGVGDLIVTCSSPSSRNRTVGERLGRGESLDAILGPMLQVAEGVCTCGPALDLARACDVETPLMAHVGELLAGRLDPDAAVLSLMRRDPKAETLA